MASALDQILSHCCNFCLTVSGLRSEWRSHWACSVCSVQPQVHDDGLSLQEHGILVTQCRRRCLKTQTHRKKRDTHTKNRTGVTNFFHLRSIACYKHQTRAANLNVKIPKKKPKKIAMSFTSLGGPCMAPEHRLGHPCHRRYIHFLPSIRHWWVFIGSPYTRRCISKKDEQHDIQSDRWQLLLPTTWPSDCISSLEKSYQRKNQFIRWLLLTTLVFTCPCDIECVTVFKT